MTNPSLLAPAVWAPAAPTRVRGSLAVIAGRDESTKVYERFGRRISFDGYLVGVFESSESAAAARWLAEQETSPRVLVGSDAGVAAVLAALAAGSDADGAIVAGTPIEGVSEEAPDAGARTSCPVHLGVLSDASSHASSHAGATAEVAALPDRSALAAVTTPVLAVHGGADPIAPLADAIGYLDALPHLEVVETVGGLHDALNDASHRSVAAQVVLWLERLRAGDVAAPIVRVGASATKGR